MEEKTHPFFGNQHADGGYVKGSFRFAEGLVRNSEKQIKKAPVSEAAIFIEPLSNPSIPDTAKTKIISKNKWIVPTVVIAAIATVGGYAAYKHYKKKKMAKIATIGICEYCGKPLTASQLVFKGNNSHIVCKKCSKKNHVKYSNNTQ